MTLRDIIIVDLDGTVADATHRLHHISRDRKDGPDWRAFYAACPDDAPIHTVIHTIMAMVDGFRVQSDTDMQVWFVTGRGEEVLEQTREWIIEHCGAFDNLLMRPNGDHTADYKLKRRWLEDGTIPKDRVFCVFEDRDQVVEMWRSEGLTCFQVAEGDF